MEEAADLVARNMTDLAATATSFADASHALDVDFVRCCRFVIEVDALFDVDHSVSILSEDEQLLNQMFNYLVSLGEPGFTYDGSSEAKERRRRMARKEPGGMYLDEFPGGLVYWDGGEYGHTTG